MTKCCSARSTIGGRRWDCALTNLTSLVGAVVYNSYGARLFMAQTATHQ